VHRLHQSTWPELAVDVGESYAGRVGVEGDQAARYFYDERVEGEGFVVALDEAC
jgi:hypothetical protein